MSPRSQIKANDKQLPICYLIYSYKRKLNVAPTTAFIIIWSSSQLGIFFRQYFVEGCTCNLLKVELTFSTRFNASKWQSRATCRIVCAWLYVHNCSFKLQTYLNFVRLYYRHRNINDNPGGAFCLSIMDGLRTKTSSWNVDVIQMVKSIKMVLINYQNLIRMVHIKGNASALTLTRSIRCVPLIASLILAWPILWKLINMHWR